MLDELGVLAIRGPEARRFLQGQLSNDIEQLSPGHSLLAGLHTPQGRTVALLRLLAAGEHDVLAILPREIAATAAALLRRYVLRAKVTLADESPQWRIEGLRLAAGATVAFATGPAAPLEDGSDRWLHVAPAASGAAEPPPGASISVEEWRRADVAAGMPQVYAATSGTFVAQMLNLDCIGAISFRKGCYTGQEVIARAHYRGRVKRRMQRFRVRTHEPLAPGSEGRFTDGRGFIAVQSARLAAGEIEMLAVAPLVSATAEEAPDPARETPGSTALLEAEALPLPYPLPD